MLLPTIDCLHGQSSRERSVSSSSRPLQLTTMTNCKWAPGGEIEKKRERESALEKLKASGLLKKPTAVYVVINATGLR